MSRARRRVATAVRSVLARRGFALVRVEEGGHHLVSRVDDRRPIPPDADPVAGVDRLDELRRRYAAVDAPVTEHSQWDDVTVRPQLDLRYFRGDSPIMWHYLEEPRVTRLKYFAYLAHLEQRDTLRLFERLEEDGAFGCWTFDFPGRPTVSRDLLDSVNELLFLDRHVGLADRSSLRVLDVGAGYGRLAHRMATAVPGLVDYCCVDAIPESTFLSEHYLHHRAVVPPARVVELPDVDDVLADAAFDLVVNVHSFSECTHAAVAWWAERLAAVAAPWLLVVPNEPTELLTTEVDGTRRDFSGLLRDAGYELAVREPVLADPALRELLAVHDHFHLYRHRR